MTATTCWADPLTSLERAKLMRMLERSFKDIRSAVVTRKGQRTYSADRAAAVHGEIADLHMDVKERAEVAPDRLDLVNRAWAAKTAKRLARA